MAFDPRPKVSMVVEESPWTEFFRSLPDMLLAYQGMQRDTARFEQEYAFKEKQLESQIAAAEKDRQFQESNIYLNNLLTTERDIQKRIYEKIDEATEYGLNVEDKIATLDSLTATQNGSELVQLGKDLHEQNIGTLQGIDKQLTNEISLFNKGKLLYDTIDWNDDNILDEEDFLKYQETLNETAPEFALPESFRLGAQFGISDPKNRLLDLQLEEVGLDIEQTKLQTQVTKSTEARAVAAEARKIKEFGLKEEEMKLVKSEYGFKVAEKYNQEKLTSMTGKPSVADYTASSYFANLFKDLSRPEIMTLIEQTPQEYHDVIPQDIDYSDFQNAIAPQMTSIVAANIAANPDMMDVLNLTSEDIETSSPEFQNIVAKGVLNAMSGFEQNPNYRFKSDIEVTQAKVLEAESQAVIDKDFQVSMAQALPTLQATFTDPTTKEINDEMVDAIVDKFEEDGVEIDDDQVEALISSLVVQQDPTTLAIMMQDKDKYSKILEYAGLGTLSEVVSAAGKLKAKSRGKYKPKTRITRDQAKVFDDLLDHKKESNKLVSKIEKKHSDVMDDPLSYTGKVGWTDEGQIPIPILGLQLQQLSLDLLQTTTVEEADAIRARMIELEHLLDQAKKGMNK